MQYEKVDLLTKMQHFKGKQIWRKNYYLQMKIIILKNKNSINDTNRDIDKIYPTKLYLDKTEMKSFLIKNIWINFNFV